MTPKTRIKLLSLINKIIPKKKNQILIYGRRMLNDNSAAILDYLIENNYNSKYKIKVCIVSDVPHEKYKNVKNVTVITNPLRSIFNIFRSMCIFHAHGMTACAVIPCGTQKIFNLWHGSPLKLIGIPAGDQWYPETDSYFLCASPFMARINQRCFMIEDNQIFIGSNPRNDLMFRKTNNEYLQKILKNRKLVIYMPTFRSSKALGREDSQTEFPLLSKDNIDEFDRFLSQKNILFLIKPHPYQDDLELFHRHYDNIIVLTNKDLKKIHLNLYELLGQSDALISDFSSVYFDYLLLNRPIGFVIEDMENYESNRGFTVENPLEIMPGIKIHDITDLKHFIDDVSQGRDEYQQQRKEINDLCNTYTSADASKRILDFLEISK